MTEYGCIGKRLTHSFSKEIHVRVADYEYRLIELEEKDVESFFTDRKFAAVNVTIPYKQTVMQYLDQISDTAKRIGAVNTVVNRNGRLYGYNTDYDGMKALIEKNGIDLKNKKVLILGTGGTSATARTLAEDMGARLIISVSRSGKSGSVTYENAVTDHRDADIIINTTPSGMYPNCASQPVDIAAFDKLEGVIDAVYNPLRTQLVLSAEEKGIPACGGLYMLTVQAVCAAEKFLGRELPPDTAEGIYKELLLSKESIVLTGMPGSGKSTVGRLLHIDTFSFFDTDEEIEKRFGKAPKDIIADDGEEHFRRIESQVIRDISSEPCRIISTGGGAILRKENLDALKRNGRIFFIDADPSRLHPDESRPLSDTAEKLAELYESRIGIYRKTAEVTLPDAPSPEKLAELILRARTEQIK